MGQAERSVPSSKKADYILWTPKWLTVGTTVSQNDESESSIAMALAEMRMMMLLSLWVGWAA
jgi:hypothetical protein